MRAFFLSSAAIAAGLAMLAVVSGFALLHTNARDREAEARRVEAASAPAVRARAKPAKGDVTAAIEAYRKAPSEDQTLAVWEAFDDLDARIATLRHTVATTIGGDRAEAEVDRIELQLHRDAEMARFQRLRERWEAALAVINALRFSPASTQRSENAGWISSRLPEREAGRRPPANLNRPKQRDSRFQPATGRIEVRAADLARRIASRD